MVAPRPLGKFRRTRHTGVRLDLWEGRTARDDDKVTKPFSVGYFSYTGHRPQLEGSGPLPRSTDLSKDRLVLKRTWVTPVQTSTFSVSDDTREVFLLRYASSLRSTLRLNSPPT